MLKMKSTFYFRSPEGVSVCNRFVLRRLFHDHCLARFTHRDTRICARHDTISYQSYKRQRFSVRSDGGPPDYGVTPWLSALVWHGRFSHLRSVTVYNATRKRFSMGASLILSYCYPTERGIGTIYGAKRRDAFKDQVIQLKSIHDFS